VTSANAAPDEGSAALGAGGASVPRHVAIIMDGNGRWAKRRGLPRAAGHKAGAEAVRRTLQAAADAGVKVLTLYAFSSENWRRSNEEISDLKGLMRYYVEKELNRLIAERVKLRLIGDYRAFGPEMTRQLEIAVEKTAANDRLTLVVALNYGSQQEIANAAAKAALAGEVTVESIGRYLETAGLPELDLLIRTSGEVRLSNFLLWQSAYAELLFTPVLWPDFDEAAFNEALDQFAARQRRFGGR
jgi:undecaprenyl diphosphate synthase